MPIKIKLQTNLSQLRLKYLCLLDNVALKDKSVELGAFKLCRHSVQELDALLRGRDDRPLEGEEKEQFEEWSALTWAHYEEQATDCEGYRKRGCNSSDWDLHRRFFLRAASVARANRLEPFRRLIETLNLMKPSDGPIRVCRILMRPVGDVQTSKQVVSRDVHSYTALWDPSEEAVTQILRGYSLEVGDKSHFATLQQQIHAKGPADGSYLEPIPLGPARGR